MVLRNPPTPCPPQREEREEVAGTDSVPLSLLYNVVKNRINFHSSGGGGGEICAVHIMAP